MSTMAQPLRLSTTAPGFEADFKARLHWSDDTDAAIEQRIQTLDGTRALIRVGEARLLPSVIVDGGSGNVGVVATPVETGTSVYVVPRLNGDQVLLDIALPERNGLEVCQQIRQHPQYAHVKVIAYTAHAQPHEVKQYLEAGFDAILTKPIQAQDILGLVNDMSTKPIGPSNL